MICFDISDGTIILKPVHNLATYIQSCKKTLFSHIQLNIARNMMHALCQKEFDGNFRKTAKTIRFISINNIKFIHSILKALVCFQPIHIIIISNSSIIICLLSLLYSIRKIWPFLWLNMIDRIQFLSLYWITYKFLTDKWFNYIDLQLWMIWWPLSLTNVNARECTKSL